MTLVANADRILDSARERPWQLIMTSERVDAEAGATYGTEDPATGGLIAQIPDASPADVDAAVEAAADAFESWRREPVRSRGNMLREMADVLFENREELGILDAIDGGNPARAMMGDVDLAVDVVRLTSEWGHALTGETIPATSEHLHYTRREPFGVVARIVPYNHPIFFAAARIAAPLLAGNTVILKPSDQTPLSALRMAELLDGVFPPGVLTVITGEGATAGEALVRHPKVSRIGFIGSVPTGMAVQRTAAESGVKSVTLELGGKNPLIVFPDTDPAKAAAGAVAGMNFTWCQGQSCGSTSRLLIHESVAEAVVEGVLEHVRQIRIGMPLDEETEMGPLISRRHQESVARHVRGAVEQGAVVAIGGKSPEQDALANGYFYEPTVLTGVEPSMSVAKEEIFGPVMSVLTFKDRDEAVAMANSVEYGLTASLWTSDLATAHRVARDLDAGYVWINGASRHFWGVPFGGVKSSGFGREESIDEVVSFTQTKAVNVFLE